MNIFTTIGYCVVCSVIVPPLMGGISTTSRLIKNGVDTVKFEVYVTKGLRNGTVVYRDGEFFEKPFNPDHREVKLVKTVRELF